MRSAPARPAGPCPATRPKSWTRRAAICLPGSVGRSAPCADRPAAAISPTSGRRKYVQGGWNITGDTYLMDADGYFWYQARTDDMIISAGYNIAGPEVEAALLAHPAVAECGVVGAPDDERGHGGQGLCGVCAPAMPRRSRADQGSPGPRQGGDRAVQVSRA